MSENEPVRLVVTSKSENLPFYIQVTVNYELLESVPWNKFPALLILQAAQRISALGDWMDHSTGQPFDKFLAHFGKRLDWSIQPRSSSE